MPISPPPAAPRADLVETLHGVEVADPFRPLEDMNAPATQAWAAAQQARTRRFLDAIPGRAAIVDFLKTAMDYESLSVPERHGDTWFAFRKQGLEPQASLVVRRDDETDWHVAIDPNGLSHDGTVALSGSHPSVDGTRIAYLTSTAGSDWQELRIRDLASGGDLDDVLTGCRFTAVAWHPGGTGFLYSRPARDGEAPAHDRDRHRLYWHRLGTPQAEDRLVFERPELARSTIYPYLSWDERHFLCSVQDGTDPNNGIFVCPIDELRFEELVPVGKAEFWATGLIGGRWYLLTDHAAPNRRLVAVDPALPEAEHWREIVPESAAILDGWRVVGDRLLLSAIVDASHRLFTCGLDGGALTPVPLPPMSSVALGWARRGAESIPIGLFGFTRAMETYRFDAATSGLTLTRPSAARLNLDDVEVRQDFVTSSDGARVPVTIIHRADIARDGTCRALLTGYGGFGISLLPSLSFEAVNWVRRGGVFAVANLRGGAEYGRAWHDAARKRHKTRSFDDFVACAEHLIATGYTSPERLAIKGTSNGGLLVSACMIRRPDLFGAVVAEVPVTDMLRFHKFTVGGYWISDYGDPDDAEDFAILRGYSPLHTIEHDQRYPPILITTADHDDRVVPAHAYKLTAALQETQPVDSKVFLRVGARAGHGAGRPTEKLINDLADVAAFLETVL